MELEAEVDFDIEFSMSKPFIITHVEIDTVDDEHYASKYLATNRHITNALIKDTIEDRLGGMIEFYNIRSIKPSDIEQITFYATGDTFTCVIRPKANDVWPWK